MKYFFYNLYNLQNPNKSKTMKHVKGPYLPNSIYWLMVGKEAGHYKYALLGRYIKGKFEFRNNEAIPGYIYIENVSPDMTPPPIDE